VSNRETTPAGERLTPMMRALLQAADCFVSPEAIPHILLLAPLLPRAMPEGEAALAGLLQYGWLAAPSPNTALLTAKSRDFLATRHSDEEIRVIVVQAVCVTVSQLVEARDEVMLRLVEPHLRALADAWLPRGDRYAMALSLSMATYLDAVGSQDAARPYLERAKALDAALGASAAKAKRPWWAWW
jgi:hypothetical protein